MSARTDGRGNRQVFECLAFYEDHRAEIDTLVARQMICPDDP